VVLLAGGRCGLVSVLGEGGGGMRGVVCRFVSFACVGVRAELYTPPMRVLNCGLPTSYSPSLLFYWAVAHNVAIVICSILSAACGCIYSSYTVESKS